MNSDERDLLVAQMVSQPNERARLLADKELTVDERREVEELVAISDEIWLAGQGAPALRDDPVAAMLGLVPDAACHLSSRGFARTRRRSGLGIGEVARRLRQRGWETQERDVFRWETRSSSDVSPALVQAIAAVLRASVDDLISTPASPPESTVFASVRKQPLFQDLVRRWAQLQGVSRAVAVAALESRMVATVHRGDEPDADQILRSLEVLVAAAEKGKRP
jgi:hypothetical protein